MADKEFPKGMFFKLPGSNAPEYVKGKFLIHVEDAVEYLQGIESEWLSLDALVSKGGKPYLAVDTWTPDQKTQKQIDKAESQSDTETKIDDDGLLF